MASTVAISVTGGSSGGGGGPTIVQVNLVAGSNTIGPSSAPTNNLLIFFLNTQSTGALSGPSTLVWDSSYNGAMPEMLDYRANVTARLTFAYNTVTSQWMLIALFLN